MNTRLLLIATTLLLLSGCQSPNPAADKPPKPLSAEILKARVLFEEGRLSEALVACVDIGHRHPNEPGLEALRAEIMTTIADRRQQSQQLRRDDSVARTMLESGEDALLPDTFRLRRFLQGNDSTHVRPKGPMAVVLAQTISLHFDNVSLAEILAYLAQEKQINLISDANLTTPPVTIHAENITLAELFDYLSRNMSIDFNLGNGVIWITPSAEARSATPLFTRLYRIRHGLPTQYLNDSGVDDTALVLLDALDRFVPKPDGADLLFDSNSHILLVKNSERNLAIVDQLVEAMDVTPPQVLIEARFISTSISDLRELGIDWLLNSPVTLSEKGGAARTQLDSGATVSFGESLNAGEGFTGTFTGILTDPQFQAVLHALEIKSDARTLSAPKVIAVNNRPARIRIGRDLAYISDVDIERETFGTGEDREELLIRDPVVETLETGYQLDASVSVGYNRRDITLQLRPEIVELIRFREISQTSTVTNENSEANADLVSSSIEVPEVARSLIETEVIVQSGETVAMGGLMRQRTQDEVRGVPLLSSLPLLGRFFQRSKVSREQENLLVFVTATLISKHGEDLVPVNRATPDAAEARGRFIENNNPPDESITD
jgi:type II secretory pathway component GspD/PulD (secretin)